LQHTTHLVDRLLSRLRRQVVKHDRIHNDVERRTGKWERLGEASLELNVSTGFLRFAIGPLDHFGRGSHARHKPIRTNLTLRCNRKRSRSATDVQHRFAGLQTRWLEHSLAKAPLSSKRDKPEEQVVTRRPVDHRSARRASRRLAQLPSPSSPLGVVRRAAMSSICFWRSRAHPGVPKTPMANIAAPAIARMPLPDTAA